MYFSTPVIKKCANFINQKPLVRGMIVYSITWPTSSFIQQYFKSETYNYGRIIRFGLYGTFFVAPTVYGWMLLSCKILPKTTLKYAFIKAGVEQVTYGPFAISCYYFGMTLLDGGSINDSLDEVREKFLRTWKVGCVVWPAVQTINYSMISEKNRLVFVSACSFLWTVFLAFMKYRRKDEHHMAEENSI